MDPLPEFPDLTPSELAALMEHAVTRSYPKNAVIINEGDEGDSVYFVIHGKVKVFLSNDQGLSLIHI